MLALVLAPLIAVATPPAPICAAPPTVQTAQREPLRARKLGDLPDAEMDLAVIRSVGGCYVREVVRFNVSDANPASRTRAQPTPGYTGRLVPDRSTVRPDLTGR